MEVAKLMRQHHVGDIVVIKESDGENVPIGIVTDRDLVVEILAQELSPDTVTVGDIMSFEIMTARDDESIWDTLQKMRIKGVRRMPVVNQRGGLVGIVTLDDLLELLTDELAGLAKTISREQERERIARK
jgi:CBS domain-containing protein